jgi:hypothetical protein
LFRYVVFPASRSALAAPQGRASAMPAERNQPYRFFPYWQPPTDNTFHSEIIPQILEKYQCKTDEKLPKIERFFRGPCCHCSFFTIQLANLEEKGSSRRCYAPSRFHQAAEGD